MTKRLVISGCSGGGKSTLLIELANRGYPTVEEPGRRIIAEQRKSGGSALPWIDPHAFARRAIDTSRCDINRNPDPSRWVFFDRGLIDAASALAEMESEPIAAYLEEDSHYHRKVFLTPPWPEIYVNDRDRRHPLRDAIKEYDRLLEVYPSIGYEVLILSKASVQERAAYVLEQLED